MTELSDYRRIVERPNIARMQEAHARALGAMRDRSFVQGMVTGIVIAGLAAAFLFNLIH